MQNRWLWTVGSKFKKLRGLLAKIWAKLQILLNTPGLRVIFKEVGGLFSKNPGRNGIFRSDPLDQDLRALIRWDLNLILCIDLRSNGQGEKARGAVALLAEARLRGGPRLE